VTLERGDLLSEERRGASVGEERTVRQLGLFAARSSAVEHRLRELDVTRMTPLQALNELHALAEMVRVEGATMGERGDFGGTGGAGGYGPLIVSALLALAWPGTVNGQRPSVFPRSAGAACRRARERRAVRYMATGAWRAWS